MRHNADDLRQMQSLPLEAKIIMTQRRIREWFDYWSGDVYLSFSGGKDSTVLKHIVDNTPGVYDVPAVFVNTGLEYPEIQTFVRNVKAGKYSCFNNYVEIVRPDLRFDEVITKYGYPVGTKRAAAYTETARRFPDSQRAKWLRGKEKTKFVSDKWAILIDAPFPVSAKCCDIMKKKPMKEYSKRTGRKPIVGTMACESNNREMAWIQNGCNAFTAKEPTSQPLAFWTEQDILRYIKQFDVPYCSVYGNIVETDQVDFVDGQTIEQTKLFDTGNPLTTTGCKRTGCMFCMFGCHLEKEPNRFQRMKITHPKQYEYCMNQLGLKEVLDYIGVPYK